MKKEEQDIYNFNHESIPELSEETQRYLDWAVNHNKKTTKRGKIIIGFLAIFMASLLITFFDNKHSSYAITLTNLYGVFMGLYFARETYLDGKNKFMYLNIGFSILNAYMVIIKII